jgi:histidine triad (HIT) family protein
MECHAMTIDPSCVFCRIIAGQAEASLVYQDDRVTAFMDIRPVNQGHTLIVPNKHAPNVAALDEEISGHMFIIGRRIAGALRRSGIRCEGVNLFMADGSAAGQTVFHSHLHVVPRHVGDGFGFRFPSSYERGAHRAELDQIAARLKMSLEGGDEDVPS